MPFHEDGDRRMSRLTVFTLCSNNYLAYAKTLGESVVRHDPDARFVIGLVDERRPDLDYSRVGPFEILQVEEIGIPDFEGFWKRYNLVELNTAVKPFYFEHFFRERRSDVVVFLDPDVEVYSSLQPVVESLGSAAVLLTPHILTPIPVDGLSPAEPVFLRFGLYNLGLLAMADRQDARAFLEWWKARTAASGYDRPDEGLFVDQLWINLAPIFFNGIRIARHAGLNVAYWNLHERRLSQTDDHRWLVNGSDPLVFFHFSQLDRKDAHSISKVKTRYHFGNRPDLRELVQGYREQLVRNEVDRFQGVPCAYEERRLSSARDDRERSRRLRARRSPISFLAGTLASRLLEAATRTLQRFQARLAAR